MKIQHLKLALAIVGIFTLSACQSMSSGSASDGKITAENVAVTSETANDSPKVASKPLVPVETETPAAPAPAPAPVETAPAPGSSGPVWHTITNYDAHHPTLPAGDEIVDAQGGQDTGAIPGVVKINPSVDVYPVGAPDVEAVQSNAGMPGDGGITLADGEMIQQIFFPYGSSKISGIDSKNLREMAQSLVRSGAGFRLNVVGHASKLVNHVKDPVKRKMINFKMAQKRANAVAKVLVKAGAAPDWIEASSAGDAQPNRRRRHGKSHEAADRRAEVYLNNN